MDSGLKRSTGPAKTLTGTGWDPWMTPPGRQRFRGGVRPVLAALREAQGSDGLGQDTDGLARAPTNWRRQTYEWLDRDP